MCPAFNWNSRFYSRCRKLVADPLHHPARHRVHPTHIHDQPDQMTTTRYWVGVLAQIALFLIVLPVSESARQERNRIFGYRPPGSSRQSRNSRQNGNSGCKSHATGRQAVNASWLRSFICLASEGQFCPPSTSERIKLTLNGLGEKNYIPERRKCWRCKWEDYSMLSHSAHRVRAAPRGWWPVKRFVAYSNATERVHCAISEKRSQTSKRISTALTTRYPACGQASRCRFW